MDDREARGLRVNERVEWEMDGSKGTVAEVGYAGVKVRWDDGGWGLFKFGEDWGRWARLKKVVGGGK